MPVDTLHIILSIAIVALTTIVIWLIVRLKNRNKVVNRRINKLTNSFETEKEYFEKEIKRQNYVIVAHRQKNGSKGAALNITAENTVQANQQFAQDAVSVREQDFVENTNFRDKNKKLWELSIAVHKEKDRIDKLKNEIEHRHEEVTKSITYAKRIQKALLPSPKIISVRFADYFIMWKPRDIVSGDFYWFKRLDDRMVIVVADSTGHGVPGAFMSLLGISFLNDLLTKDKTLKSNQILDKLREMIKLALQQEVGKKSKASDGIDMAVCIINNKSMEVDFSGANNPLYLIRDKEILLFKANRNPVGIHPFEKPFTNHVYTLKKDDRLYMFSDGFIDQFGGQKGRKFLKNNFQRLLLHIAQQDLPMEIEKEILEDTLSAWKGDVHPQIDDILILGLKM